MRLNRSLLSVLVGSLIVLSIVLHSKSRKDFMDLSVSITYEPGYLEDNGERDVEKNKARNAHAYRYVTPSLAELGARGILPEMNKDVLMVTRVPGAGAELLVLILQRLQGYNAFKHIRLPPGDDGILTTLQQELLVEEVTSIISQEAIPLSFDGDVRFLNFSEFGRQAPTFISLVRDPLDPRTLQRQRNSKWALERAKEIVRRWYPVIGILDSIDDTLKALENTFPNFFLGASRIYAELWPKDRAFRKTEELKPRVRNRLMKILETEVEFYRWIRSRLLNETCDNG